MRRPLDVHLEACTTREIIKPTEPEPCQLRDAGHGNSSVP